MNTTTTASIAAPAPSVHRRALITWLGVYPTICAELWLLGSAIGSWPLLIRALTFSVIVVPVNTYLLAPLLFRGNNVLNRFFAKRSV
jgi:antibiotic biosynthesis monooxygenase (ABM) superfamily enzyme